MSDLDNMYCSIMRALETDFVSLSADEQAALRTKLRVILKSDINDPDVIERRFLEAMDHI